MESTFDHGSGLVLLLSVIALSAILALYKRLAAQTVPTLRVDVTEGDQRKIAQRPALPARLPF